MSQVTAFSHKVPRLSMPGLMQCSAGEKHPELRPHDAPPCGSPGATAARMSLIGASALMAAQPQPPDQRRAIERLRRALREQPVGLQILGAELLIDTGQDGELGETRVCCSSRWWAVADAPWRPGPAARPGCGARGRLGGDLAHRTGSSAHAAAEPAAASQHRVSVPERSGSLHWRRRFAGHP